MSLMPAWLARSPPSRGQALRAMTGFFETALFVHIAGGQDFVRIGAHHEIDDLGRGDLRPPMRRIGRNDDHATGVCAG